MDRAIFSEDEPALVLATIGRWTPLVPAAVLVVGVLAFVIALQAGNAPTQRQSVKHTTPPLDPTVITVKHAQHFGKRHLSCSRGLEELPRRATGTLAGSRRSAWGRPSWALSLWASASAE
ncbi:MAG: hypothetical protein QF785_08500 [Phycisphaeraceae bacterium]|nr:hypothetical protein [Phycisphaeraceae bacterium]MDP7346982.1 hypothetical protein [Phycisphaeraceae bacterium]